MNLQTCHYKLPPKRKTVMPTRTQQEKIALELIRLKKVLNKIRRERKKVSQEEQIKFAVDERKVI